jgi:predicted ATPase with chaperone activity
MRLAEALETTRIPRVAGLTGARTAVVTRRPCRASPHTISDVGVIGWGQMPVPGEVSRAPHGLLCLMSSGVHTPWARGPEAAARGGGRLNTTSRAS